MDSFSYAISQYANMWGIAAPSMMLLFSVCISLGLALFLVFQFKNKELGAFAFFFMYGITAIIGWTNWIAFALPLIAYAVLKFYSMRSGGGD